jgi:hypothetical protein
MVIAAISSQRFDYYKKVRTGRREGGREGGREGRREGRREGGREGRREGGKEGGREGGAGWRTESVIAAERVNVCWRYRRESTM